MTSVTNNMKTSTKMYLSVVLSTACIMFYQYQLSKASWITLQTTNNNVNSIENEVATQLTSNKRKITASSIASASASSASLVNVHFIGSTSTIATMTTTNSITDNKTNNILRLSQQHDKTTTDQTVTNQKRKKNSKNEYFLNFVRFFCLLACL